jgi:tetratricopeptide (TPR) repeat protein
MQDVMKAEEYPQAEADETGLQDQFEIQITATPAVPGMQAPHSEIDDILKTATEHHAAGRFAEAEEFYVQALHLDGNHPIALKMLGTLAFQLSQDDIALDLLSKAIAIKPDYFDARLDLGTVLCAQERFDEGIRSYFEAMKLNPISADLYFRLAKALTDLGQDSEAREWYQKALEIEPSHAGARAALDQS